MTKGDILRITFKTLVSSALLGILLVLPLMLMQLVNRRDFHEEFPFVLFAGLWLGPFALGLILLPIASAWRRGNHDLPNLAPTRRNTLLANPAATAAISIVLILIPVLRVLLESLGWAPLSRLINGPNPEAAYLPGRIVSLGLGLLPVAAGIIAAGPIVDTLRAGGRLFAHPLHLIIVVALSSLFAVGLVFLIADQWPCFIGVPNCD